MVVNYSVTAYGVESADSPLPCFGAVWDTMMVSQNPPNGSLGIVWNLHENQKTFRYSIIVGPYNNCGDYTVKNTANLMLGSDVDNLGPTSSWSIAVTVSCNAGYTLTHGYWKTHSSYGPAPYDDTWALVSPIGEDTQF